MFDYNLLQNETEKYFNELINNSKDINLGIDIYISFYNQVIKGIESKEHYEKCFSIINPLFNKYLEFSFPKNLIDKQKNNNKKIIIFLPNIQMDLAHTNFLYSILTEIKDHNYDITIASSFSNINKISKNILNLKNKNILKNIILLEYHKFSSIENFIKLNLNFSCFIVWGLPLIIPLWTKIYSNKVIFVTTKFEYGSFNDLNNAISFQSQKNKTNIKIGNTNWHRLPPFCPYLKFKEHSKSMDDKLIKLISVNRPEKINDPIFLNCLSKILISNDNAIFYYCGKHQDKILCDYFASKNLLSRIKFLGWIDPESVIGNFDIFLDSNSLSGILAVNYFISGMPVVTFNNCLSYISLNNQKLKNELNHNFSFNEIEYVEYTNKLIRDTNFLMKVTNLQKKSKKIFIENNSNIANKFVETINEINSF